MTAPALCPIRLPVGVTLSRDLFIPTDDPALASYPEFLHTLQAVAPYTSFALVADGTMIGYAALIPGEPGYCHAALYIAPAQRDMGEGLRAVALSLGRGLIALAARLGCRAMAAHPGTPGQLRYAYGLGGEDSGVALPVTVTRCSAPVLIWRFNDDSAGTEIARRCFPRLFPQCEPVLAALRLTEQLLGSHGISLPPRDLRLREDFSEARRLSAADRRMLTDAR